MGEALIVPKSVMPHVRVLALSLLLACRPGTLGPSDDPPPAPPARWMPLIGEYGSATNKYMVLERDGKLVLKTPRRELPLVERRNDFAAEDSTQSFSVTFTRRDSGHVKAMVLMGNELPAIALGPESGNQLLVTPVRPIDVLRREALAAQPPAEAHPFKPTDLVELVSLDSTIHLEIRYATSNNLFGTPFYTQARAFMQRDAAEALVRANAALRRSGYGLLIHDGYRPWYVTKMFWEAAPVEKRIFVANPDEGSKHNRGAAVDLTLYALKTGTPVDMPSTYDETTDRAFAEYPGGTSRQRWHRALLRRAMESQRFVVNPTEWWHFDYADWRQYGIGNRAFEDIP